MPTRLSVNINKIATLRNARGGQIPNLLQVASDCERFGAQGITVHPRPDERHIRYDDVRTLKPALHTEFNIEGNPIDSFITLTLDVCPHQVTLVPDAHDAITSNTGWNIKKHARFLRNTIALLKTKHIRTSIFINPDPDTVRRAADTGADRIELYTEPYAARYPHNRRQAIADFIQAAQAAQEVNIGINAGHDLNLHNLAYFRRHIPTLLEVSIGHALISDALYFGLENTIQLYLRQLQAP
ncbi:MAG: pyridoxine 5'-phosphate synthase [Prevotellaceae bacterium]|jgi:pyridoxine 5-phosphate synthase|nr:pyridoxine 5'-phosphate synthase [Prevotellaceae bacterium]